MQHPVTGKLVPADQYEAPKIDLAVNHVVTDRHHWGTKALDGTDIGSKKKRREYMKREGVADASDYGPRWGERVRESRERELSKQTRETVARVVWTDPRWKP